MQGGGGRADNKCIFLPRSLFFPREVWRDEACMGYGRGVEERRSGVGLMDGAAAAGSSPGAPVESLRVRIEWSPGSQDRGPSAICSIQLHGAQAKRVHGNIHGYSCESKGLGFNKRQVQMNEGLLADVRGNERYMSLACSHFTAFCRACIAGCLSDQETVSDHGKLSLQRLSTDFRHAVENGWEWLALSAEVDAVLPSLASFIQEVMNAAQGVARTAGELELAMAMVTEQSF